MKCILRGLLNKISKNKHSHKRPLYLDESVRYNYQKMYVHFDLSNCKTVVDLGCGSDPFPLSTHLVDLFLTPTVHRKSYIKKDSRPLVVADIHNLPFPNKYFDFIYCSHVLEHVDDPIKACSEIIRIGRRGYIETPTLAKDGLFSWARGQHRWHIVLISDILCFFEYDERRVGGINSNAWYDCIHSSEYHPLQEAYFSNLDFFNNMFQWKDSFKVYVFYLNGAVATSEPYRST